MARFIIAVFLGASLTVGFTMLPTVAPWYSRKIHDCGIRIASDASGEVSGFVITGHRFGICVD